MAHVKRPAPLLFAERLLRETAPPWLDEPTAIEDKPPEVTPGCAQKNGTLMTNVKRKTTDNE